MQLRFEAPKDFNLAMASRLAALNGNASSIATFLVIVIIALCTGEAAKQGIVFGGVSVCARSYWKTGDQKLIQPSRNMYYGAT